MEAANYGILSLIPLALTLLLAFWKKDAVFALFMGCLSGVLLLGHDPAFGFSALAEEALGNEDFIWILLIQVFIGIMIAFFMKAGVVKAFAEMIAGKVKSPRSVKLATWFIGLFTIDDYMSPLLRGVVMRPLTDEMRVPREKLAFLLDSTCASVCTLMPFMAWGAYVAGLVADLGGPVTSNEQGVSVYISAIPFNFYAILMVLITLLSALEIFPDFGPMRKAEQRARTTGKLLRDGAVPMMGTELEVDAICDGEDILIPGIMEHIERTGVHSGDSIAVYPAWNINDVMTDKIIESSRNLAISLNTKGLVNIQYLIYHNELYVIEVNPRSSRTIPYISKVTGVPMVDLATRAMLGEKLKDMGYGTGLYKKSPYVAIKVPVFSFEKLINVDTHLGPEMKSTGEVLGIAGTLEEALYKGLIAAGYKMKKDGGVFITVRDSDKNEIAEAAKKYADLGFTLYATKGTAKVLAEAGIQAIPVNKIHEDDHNNTIELIESGKIQYVISTSSKGRIPTRDSVKIRRKAVERSIPCLTSIDTANAMANSLRSRYSPYSTELVDINDMRTEKIKANFTKMHGCGNDYIYFDCFQHDINNPEARSVRLSDRHYGIGGDGVILVCPSDVADGKMRMFNLDGSEGKMCGNGIRCVGKFLYDHGLVDPAKEKITVETLSGIKTLWPIYNDRKVCAMKVDMGKAELTPALIPVDASKLPDPKADRIVNAPYTVDGVEYHVTCVSMGNPHCVVFKNDVETMDIEKIGPAFETSELFPERVNTEFIRVLDDHTLKMRVWERGSGETWACGTGACAAAVAAVENGYCKKDTDITVKLIGGDLVIRYTDDTVYMTGNAVTVYEGVVEI